MTGAKFMTKLHVNHPRFTYIACGPFTKHCERIQRFRETDNFKHLYRKEWGIASFAHDAAYYESKDLAKITISDKILQDRACKIARNRKYERYERAIASMVYKFLIRK